MEDIGEVATAAAGVVLDSVSALGGVLLAVGCFPASMVCLNKLFCQSIGRGVVWSTPQMFNTVGLGECCKFGGGKLKPIV